MTSWIEVLMAVPAIIVAFVFFLLLYGALFGAIFVLTESLPNFLRRKLSKTKTA